MRAQTAVRPCTTECKNRSASSELRSRWGVCRKKVWYSEYPFRDSCPITCSDASSREL